MMAAVGWAASCNRLHPFVAPFLVAGLAAQGPADQRGRSISHVAGNHIVGQFRPLHMPQRGIDRVHQIEAGVDQRAVKVEDYQLDCAGIEWAIEFDHAGALRINDDGVCWGAALGNWQLAVGSIPSWLYRLGGQGFSQVSKCQLLIAQCLKPSSRFTMQRRLVHSHLKEPDGHHQD